eukprot:jgi/Astpho2/15/fgenesh1_pg.00001_%23_9_t
MLWVPLCVCCLRDCPAAVQYVDTLSEQLADLRASKTKRVQPEVIAAYEEHEDLTDDMAGLAASLKRNVMAINSAVKDREGLLRDTEELMEHNQQAASWNVTVSKHVKRRNAVELCMVIGVLMMVCGVSVAVYMQIKITSFLGYKASKNT